MGRQREDPVKPQKINCWEFKECGRGPGQSAASGLAPCPAATDNRCDGLNHGHNAGRICWAVTGTVCGGRVQGSFAKKGLQCMSCDFFAAVKEQEGADFLLLRRTQELEEVFREAEHRYRAMFDGVPIGLFRSTPTGELLDANPMMVQMLGYGCRADVLGIDLGAMCLLQPSDAHVLERVATDGMVQGVETQLRRPDDSTLWARLSVRAVQTEDGRAVYYEGAVEDVTQRREAELQLRRSHEHLEMLVQERTKELEQATDEARRARDAAEAANRTKSTFLANMSHELRTPLNAVIGYSELVQEEMADLGQQQFVPELEKIQAAGRHLLALINDVLDLSKIEAGKLDLYLEQFDVRELLDTIMATVQPLADCNGNRLELRIDGSLGTVRADLTRTRQVLLNLLSNACKFTEGGVIELAAARCVEAGHDWLELRVRDTGIGMSPEQLDTVFDAFRQADASTTRKYGGTGLGLAISRKFCEMMGGRLVAESHAGEGSIFTVRIPAQVRAAASAAPPDSDGAMAPHPDAFEAKVLVIDDDPAVGELLGQLLRRDQLGVVAAGSGPEGVRLATEIQPLAIILDVLMPGVDGWAVLQQLKAEPATASIPVIMLTVTEERGLAYALGAADHLTKPVDRQRLLAAVRKSISGEQQATILVVEDDEATRHIVARSLRREGWSVTTAINGRDALDELAKGAPSVILLDLMMPEMDGFEFLRRCQQTEGLQRIPVVVMTAKTLTEEERLLLNGWAEKVFEKGSFDERELLSQVRDLVLRYASSAGARKPAVSGVVR